MGKEIERRFLVKENFSFDNYNKNGYKDIIQGYFDCFKPSIRIRISTPILFPILKPETTGTITIKSKSINFTKHEFEYSISHKEAEDMLVLYCGERIVRKHRYIIKINKNVWEVDEFIGLDYGLIIAEIELYKEDQEIEIPNWISKEITGISKYSNHSLALKNEKHRKTY